MPSGKSKVKFQGGTMDGQHYDEFDSVSVLKELTFSTGLWFREVDGGAQLIKGGELDKNWDSYEVDVYKKGKKDSDGYFTYKFKGSRIIERCPVITKKGKRCLNPCYKNLSVCSTHKPRKR